MSGEGEMHLRVTHGTSLGKGVLYMHEFYMNIDSVLFTRMGGSLHISRLLTASRWVLQLLQYLIMQYSGGRGRGVKEYRMCKEERECKEKSERACMRL